MTGDAGFGLLEVVIAATVVFGALTSVAYLGTVAMTDLAAGRLRQSATSLANQAIEQVRALPRETVKLGLQNADLATADPDIVASAGEYRFRGERIPHGDTATVAPLVPHRAQQVVSGTSFTVAVYVTYADDDATSGAFRVTAIVSWAAGSRATVVRRVEVQTIVDALGCESGTTHPFAAPCQAFLYSTGSSAPGGITVDAAGDGPALPGAAFDRVVLTLPTQSGNLQSEQSAAAQSRVTTSGISYRSTADELDAWLGGHAAFASADSDPSATRPPDDSSSTASQLTESWSVAGTGATLALQSSAGDTGAAKATTTATGVNCPDEASPPTNLSDNQTCATGTTSQASVMRATLSVAGLGTADLVAVGTGTNGAAHVKRTLAAKGAATCPAPDGCARAAVRRTLGTIGIGGLPSGVQAPLGFDYLVRVQGLTTTVSAQAGVGNAAPSVSRTGTIAVWNGTGYTSLAATTGASAPLTALVPTFTANGLAASVEISASLVTGATSAPACASPCTSAVARADSPVIGDIGYRVVVAGVVVADLHLHIDLGTLTASATYTPV